MAQIDLTGNSHIDQATAESPCAVSAKRLSRQR